MTSMNTPDENATETAPDVPRHDTGPGPDSPGRPDQTEQTLPEYEGRHRPGDGRRTVAQITAALSGC